MNERRELKRWCPDCRKIHKDINELKGQNKEPPCEQCFPGIHDNNNEAWSIFVLASLDAMGMTVQGILSLCEELNVSDPEEILWKIKKLNECLEKKSEQPKQENEYLRDR